MYSHVRYLYSGAHVMVHMFGIHMLGIHMLGIHISGAALPCFCSHPDLSTGSAWMGLWLYHHMFVKVLKKQEKCSASIAFPQPDEWSRMS